MFFDLRQFRFHKSNFVPVHDAEYAEVHLAGLVDRCFDAL